MKQEDITALLPEITKEQLDKIMDLHGRDIQAQSNTITTLTAERDGLKTQLADATTEIQSYKDMDIDGIKTKAAEWETKYNTDTAALRQQLPEKFDADTRLVSIVAAPVESGSYVVKG